MDESMLDATGARARLIATCPDQPGIVAAVSGFFFELGANIIHSDQHSSDPVGGTFFLRQEFVLEGLDMDLEAMREAFDAHVARRFGMDWSLHPAWVPKRAAILVSREGHALMDLLWRVKSGELFMDVACVVSNHRDLEEDAANFGVPFVHVPVAKASRERDLAATLAEVEAHGAELVLLARYMQVLPQPFVDRYRRRIINIHHSFLPAFVGADPYRRAAERGVKLIGATAHYVTADLDQGPIIEQDVIRVTHRHRIADLKVLGRDIERQVFSRAVRWHLEDRVIVDGNKTVVFI